MKNFTRQKSERPYACQIMAGKYYLLMLILTALTSACSPTGKNLPPDHVYDKEKLLTDLQVFRGALHDFHPALYWHLPEKELDLRIDRLSEMLDTPMTVLEFQSQLAGIVADIRCGHTRIDLNEQQKTRFWKEGSFLPLDVKIVNDRVYCFASQSENDSIKPGNEILQINGREIHEIMQKLVAKLPNDGNIRTRKIRFLERDFSGLYAQYLDQPDTFKITYADGSDSLKTAHIPSRSANHIFSHPQKTFEKTSDDKIELHRIDSAGAWLLTIRSFNDWEKEGNEVSFKQSLQDAFKEIDASDSQHLIIDLRNNGGGDDEMGMALFSYLTDQPFTEFHEMSFRVNRSEYYQYSDFNPFYRWLIADILLDTEKVNDSLFLVKDLPTLLPAKPAKFNYEGNVYLLTNGRTFSTAADVAALVRSHGRGLLIGEMPGGGYYGNSSGLDIHVKLPETGLQLKIPTVRYRTNVKPLYPEGSGIVPDFEVNNSIADHLRGTDTVLNYTLTLTKQSADENF